MNKADIVFIAAGILSAAMFMLFALSGITANFHLGCAVGMAVSALMCAAFFGHDAVGRIIMTLWQTRRGRTGIIAVGSVIAVCVIIAVLISVLMIKAACRTADSPSTVIVLGCRVKESGPSLMLKKRIDAAYEYLSENDDVICIASGGKGADEPVSEAECIRQSLIDRGITPERIICEDKSENTFQNIRNSIEIIDGLGIERRAVIVTSEFHQLRAGMLCRKQGLDVSSVNAETYLPLLPSYWVREWFGVVHEFLIGRH